MTIHISEWDTCISYQANGTIYAILCTLHIRRVELLTHPVELAISPSH